MYQIFNRCVMFNQILMYTHMVSILSVKYWRRIVENSSKDSSSPWQIKWEEAPNRLEYPDRQPVCSNRLHARNDSMWSLMIEECVGKQQWVRVLFTATRWFAPHKARQQTDLLHLSADCSDKWAQLYFGLTGRTNWFFWMHAVTRWASYTPAPKPSS
jgi:hypothetical protein